MEHIAIAEEYERRGLLSRTEGANQTAFHADVDLGRTMQSGRSYSVALNLTMGGFESAFGTYRPVEGQVPWVRLSVAIWADEDDLVASLPPQANWMAARALRELGNNAQQASPLRVENPDPEVLRRLLAGLSHERVQQPERPQMRQDLGLVSVVPR